jgi:hypothetical protein
VAKQGAGARQALTEQDVAAIRADVSAGRAVTVWFTAAAVGVSEGGSAKVLAVGEVSEGEFIQVRPAGSRDALFCSPNELTRSRPARRPADARTAAEPPARTAAERPARTAAERPARAAAPKKRAESPTVGEPTVGEPAVAKEVEPAGGEHAVEVAAAARPARARRRPERTGPITVSLSSTVDGDWTVEVRTGAKRVVASTPVPVSDVAAVAEVLPAAVTEVLAAALADARRRQQEHVTRLREELDAAQRLLDQLGGD